MQHTPPKLGNGALPVQSNNGAPTTLPADNVDLTISFQTPDAFQFALSCIRSGACSPPKIGEFILQDRPVEEIPVGKPAPPALPSIEKIEELPFFDPTISRAAENACSPSESWGSFFWRLSPWSKAPTKCEEAKLKFETCTCRLKAWAAENMGKITTYGEEINPIKCDIVEYFPDFCRY